MWPVLNAAFGRRFDFGDDESWKTLNCWADDFEPTPETDYSPMLEHSRKCYEESTKMLETLDKKAEWCFAVAVASSVGVLAIAKAFSLAMDPCILPLVVLLYAMWVCLRARCPNERAMPFGGKYALEIAEWGGNRFNGRLTASLGSATEANRLLGQWKAKCIQHGYLALTIASAILSLLVCLG